MLIVGWKQKKGMVLEWRLQAVSALNFSSINLVVSFLLLDGIAMLCSERKLRIFVTHGSSCAQPVWLAWCQDNGNRANQESKFDFVATRQCLVKIDEGQQKIKIVCTN